MWGKEESRLVAKRREDKTVMVGEYGQSTCTYEDRITKRRLCILLGLEPKALNMLSMCPVL